MPDWLKPAIDAGATVVTASRRLARALAGDYATAELEAGSAAWATPPISTYGRWLAELLEGADDNAGRNLYRLDGAQSRVLWEACLEAELGADHGNLAGVVREAGKAWSLLKGFRIAPDDLDKSIENRDQGVFLRAARRYAAELAANDWVDDATIAGAVEDGIRAQTIRLPGRLVFAGFDRLTPQLETLIELARAAGTTVTLPAPRDARPIPAEAAEDRAAELRAAGAWARQRLADDPDERVAIVVTGLEHDPGMAGRLVREGFTPGWQARSGSVESLVNVSLGKTLESYPMVGVALLLIRWLHGPLTSRQLGVLLRCNFLGAETSDARARLEVKLRGIPARDWTPARVRRVFERSTDEPDTADFLARVASLGELAGSARGKATPAYWARHFDSALEVMGWPGQLALSSREQQLMNRWRDLLNELSHLELVTGPVSLPAAAEFVRASARDAVFQPEDTNSVLSVLGPLEAAGLEFDALWIAGLNADRWPAPGRSTPLLSRRLAREYGLPDSSPEDSLDFARSVLARLAGSASLVRGSYARVDGDSELLPTLVAPVEVVESAVEDPGWHAVAYRAGGETVAIDADPAPPVGDDERIRGGAGTLDAQLSEPFSAFARGRLAISSLDPFAEGLTPLMRGNLIHDALQTLYASRPDQAGIRAWSPAEREERIAAATRKAIARHRIAAGRTLERLLDFEERRIAGLLSEVIDFDLGRPPFRILSVEGKSNGTVGGLDLSLRHDRIDLAEDGSLVILDYKTGAPKRFLKDGKPDNYQLVVYAATVSEPVSDIGLYNVDSRDISINGAGIMLGGTEDFAVSLGEWIQEIVDGARLLKAGDVRINQLQGVEDARAYGLLSRYAELVRDV